MPASGFLAAIDQNFPPTATWSTNNIPDLTGQIVVVTGGNSGIGLETVEALLLKNAKVYIAARDEGKTNTAILELQQKISKTALFLQLDLGNLKSIKESAEKFSRLEPRLNVLINNAGVMLPPLDKVTSDGYDLQFGTNALGHYYFTTLLLPLLESAAKESPSRVARVVTVSSAGYTLYPKINFESLRDGPERKKMAAFDLYNQSKFGNCVFSVELSRRCSDKGIVSVAVHPGLIKSGLSRHVNAVQRAVFGWMSYPASKGALTQLWAATAPEAKTANGQYIIPWARVGEFMPEVLDAEMGKKLWTWFEAQVKAV